MENAQVFAGNLSFALEEDELKAVFEAFGEVVDAKIITDKMSGRSRGFGFITMARAENAARAIEKLEGQVLRGRPLRLGPATGGTGGRRTANDHGR